MHCFPAQMSFVCKPIRIQSRNNVQLILSGLHTQVINVFFLVYILQKMPSASSGSWACSLTRAFIYSSFMHQIFIRVYYVLGCVPDSGDPEMNKIETQHRVE